MNIKQSASILAILASVALVGAGCLSSSTKETKPVTTAKPTLNVPAELRGENAAPTPTGTSTMIPAGGTGTEILPVATKPIVTDSATVAGQKNVRDDWTGVAFSVPASIGEVRTLDDRGYGVEEDPTATTFTPTCLVNRLFVGVVSDSLGGFSGFLSIYDNWECKALGRGGYWGDQALAFSTERDVEKWCNAKESCDTFVNPNGITVYHAHTKSLEAWGDTLTDIDEYGIWNPNRAINGILFSNQDFVKNGLGPQKETLRAIVDSLSFIE